MNVQNVNMNKYGNPDMPDIIYYNLDIINGKDKDDGTYPLARFNETRDGAIIKDCSQYYFSIVRFSMNGADKTLPMFIPHIKIGQTNPNLTAYTISLLLEVNYDFGSGNNKNTFFSSKPIIFQPQNLAALPPKIPETTQDLESEYYYVYNYQHFVNLINQTYQEIYNDLNTQFAVWLNSLGQPLSLLETKVPVLEYNPDTQRFSLYCDNYGWGGDNRTSDKTAEDENFEMFYNSNLFGLFSTFPHNYLGGDLSTKNKIGQDDCAYEILVNKGLKNTETINGTDYLVINQEWVSTSTLWSPISSIVFVSTLIPVLNEQTGQPVQYGQGNTLVPVGTQSAFQPIVTDIALGNENANAYNEFISYVPTAEYRLSTLSNSPQEVRNIDIQIFWKSRLDGNLYPIELFNLSNISLKIMFRRRNY